MGEDSAQDSSDSPGRPAGHNERFATLVEGDRALILASYEQSLLESNSPLMGNPRCREQALASGAEIIGDIGDSVRANAIRINECYKLRAWAIGETRAVDGLSSADSLRAAVIFFDVTTNVLARHVGENPDLLPSFVTAITALNESINKRIREATLAHTGYLLDRIHRANLDERHRIARELHDRLGEGVSGALRQLELRELTGPDQAMEPALHTTLAKRALMEAMDRLRLVVSDLRRDPVTSLEKALTEYITSVAPDVDVRLRVSGDDSWAAPTVTDEAFMIIREALRNALTHAAPQLVLIGVELTPYELHAWVEDDGRGIQAEVNGGSGSVSTAGLATMRERAALIGGSLSVSSSPGEGTRVELRVPLPGPREERSS